MTNFDRAASVDDLVRSFADDQGLDLDPEADGPETGISDMICNSLHWLSQEVGIEATIRALQNGIGAFAVEFGAHDDVAPDGDADVTLKVTGRAGEDGKMRRFRIDAGPRSELSVEGFVGSRSAFTVTKGAR